VGDISILLEIKKSCVLETESIPFIVTIANTGKDTLNLHDFRKKNESITLVVEGSSSEHLGTQLSWDERNGEYFRDPRSYTTFELAPGEKKKLEGDVLAWIGVLSPGTYQVYVAYNSGPSTYAESVPVEVTVQPAHAVTYTPASAPVRPTLALTRATWQHLSDDGMYELYLVESSPEYPPNLYRNLRVVGREEKIQAAVSTSTLESVPSRHVGWIEAGEALRVVTVEADRSFGEVEEYTLSMDDPVILRSPLSDGEGNLHLLVADRERTKIAYMLVQSTGEIKQYPLLDTTIDLDTYALMWGRQGKGFLLWKEEHGRTLSCLHFEIGATPRDSTGREVLPDVKGRTRRVALYQTYDVDTRTFHEHAYVLSLIDRPRLHWKQWRVSLGEGVVKDSRALTIPNAEAYRPYAMALTDENEPVYLFVDQNGAVSYYLPSSESLLPLFAEGQDAGGQDRITAEWEPVLYTTPSLSQKAGVYVGFIQDERAIRFASISD